MKYNWRLQVASKCVRKQLANGNVFTAPAGYNNHYTTVTTPRVDNEVTTPPSPHQPIRTPTYREGRTSLSNWVNV